MSPKVEENAALLRTLAIPTEIVPFVRGVSPAILALERVIAEVAPTDVPILLTGENGTGKEVLAIEIHRRSRNCHEPFVKCNCSGLVAGSLEVHLRSGRDTDGQGTGGHGTTFFEDINRLAAASQDILLQLLSDNGSASNGHRLRDRVISSTTSNLEEEMRAGHFRQELYYRVNGVCLRLPPLRQRQEDLPLLLDHFLRKYALAFERPQPSLSNTAMNFLLRHSWPGNIRELENFSRKFVILGDEDLALGDLAVSSASNEPEPHRAVPVHDHSNQIRSLKAAAREASRNVERQLILSSLERTHWNRKRTARELQISYKALLYKLKQLDIDGAASSKQESAEAPR